MQGYTFICHLRHETALLLVPAAALQWYRYISGRLQGATRQLWIPRDQSLTPRESSQYACTGITPTPMFVCMCLLCYTAVLRRSPLRQGWQREQTMTVEPDRTSWHMLPHLQYHLPLKYTYICIYNIHYTDLHPNPLFPFSTLPRCLALRSYWHPNPLSVMNYEQRQTTQAAGCFKMEINEACLTARSEMSGRLNSTGNQVPFRPLKLSKPYAV